MPAIAQLKKVSPPSVLHWIKKTSKLLGEKPAPVGEYTVMAIDEMWHFFEKTQKLWNFKSYCRQSKGLIDWELGCRDHLSVNRLVKRLKSGVIQFKIFYGADCQRQ